LRLALLALVSGCVDVASQFTCTLGDNAACGADGRCEASRNCSIADPTCGEHGFRYDASADPDRVGVCVLSSMDMTMTEPQPIDPQHPVAFEISTAQPIAFDTLLPTTDVPATLLLFAGGCPRTMHPIGMSQRCGMTQSASRLVVGVMSPSTLCIVATDDVATAGHIALRIFPGTTPPACIE
jgi:hypothetical protein